MDVEEIGVPSSSAKRDALSHFLSAQIIEPETTSGQPRSTKRSPARPKLEHWTIRFQTLLITAPGNDH